MRQRLRDLIRNEGGSTLLIVVVLMFVGALMLPSLLTASSTALQSGRLYEGKTRAVYAAESGMEDAIWKIRYGDMESLFTSPAYDVYDYQTEWTYSLPETINGDSVSVAVDNVWIPMNVATPTAADARNIIESGKLIVSGYVPDAQTVRVQIAFRPEAGDDLQVETIGVWLSPGFQYVAGSGSQGEPAVQVHAGGQGLLWTFAPKAFTDFPGVNPEDSVMSTTMTFQFTADDPGTAPAVVSWLTTTGASGVSHAWDADSQVYRIVSSAAGSRVEAYNIRSEVRKLGSALSGDYRAIGNSLMLDLEPDDEGPVRDALLSERQSAVSDIPADARVEAAYLYWSGWFDGSSMTPDDSAVFKIDGTQVYFDASGTPQQGAQEIVADLTQVIDNLWGYSYSSFKDVTGLLRSFSAEGDPGRHPGNGTYTVGGVDGDLDHQLSYAGWSLVIIFSSPATEGRQVYLYDDFLYSGQHSNLDYDQDGQPGGTLTGFLVPEPISGETDAAMLTCFVAEGDEYYAGDYIALNGTKLWDGTSGGSLDNVWNGQSVGMSADGVDVDTFHVTWASGLLQPGDASAQIDIHTDQDAWNLVYIVLSFRSEVTTGNSISYLLDP